MDTARALVTLRLPEDADLLWADAPIAGKLALRLNQQPVIVWLTGLSGSGKSTIANAVTARLQTIGRHVVVLDGDDLRGSLNRDLGFSPADRNESMCRAAETARLMARAG